MRDPSKSNSLDERLRRAARRYESWFREHALPLWAGTGFNPDARAFRERMLQDGAPDLKADIRVRVQARQIFVYAYARHLGWYEDGAAPATQALTFVERLAAHPKGGYVHLLDSGYKKVIDAKQDLYDHAFVLLAYAWCYRAFGIDSALQKAAALVDYLDRVFGSDQGGWLEGDYFAPYRRQNPHMHMLEALLALYDASGERRWLERAGQLVRLFETSFYDSGHKVLREYFTSDWKVHPEQGDLVEPGHMMEWSWLLRWYESRAGRPLAQYVDALYTQARALGTAPSGLLLDEIAPDGRIISATKRCWPQTEYIKASLAQARAGRREFEVVAADAIERLFRYYLDEAVQPGLYLDRRDTADRIIPGPVPASTLYHLIMAAGEASAYCRERESEIRREHTGAGIQNSE
ncbi:MAG TPA: AGE family epimerase/isomerase [Gammaproteobacteria bacterium]|nr:AGE family epimerase/isomerase [Gammaproteobacteria bacterium]